MAGDTLPATGFSITYPFIFYVDISPWQEGLFISRVPLGWKEPTFLPQYLAGPEKPCVFLPYLYPAYTLPPPCFLLYPCPCGWRQPGPHLQTLQAKCSSVSSQLGQETPSPLVAAPQSFLAPISWSLGGGGAQNLALGQQVNNSSSVMTLSAFSLFQPSLYKDHGWVMAVRDEKPVWQPLS